MSDYSEFLFLSEDALEKVAKMNDGELNFLSSFIAHSLRESQYKVEKEMRDKYDNDPAANQKASES